MQKAEMTLTTNGTDKPNADFEISRLNDLARAVFPFLTQSLQFMKRWAILTVLLYALAMLVLTAPVVLIAFGNWGIHNDNQTFKETAQLYAYWQYWLWLGVLVAGQALLLLLPDQHPECRLPTRRPLKIPVIVTAFFLGNLCFAGILSVLCAAFKDDGLNVFGFIDKIFTKDGNITMRAPPGASSPSPFFLGRLGHHFPSFRQVRRPGCTAQAHHALAAARKHPRID